MEQGEYLHVIGLGNVEDWEVGRGSVYYVEDHNGEICVPVFTTPERASVYIETTLQSPEAHMEMLGSVPVSHLKPFDGRPVRCPSTRCELRGSL
jgi:hypothetical protein